MMLLHLVVIAVLAPLCSAIRFLNTNWDVKPGVQFKLTWADQVKWAEIKLIRGRPEASLKDDEELVVSSYTELELDWQVPANKPEGDYFLRINDLTGNTNYSPMFRLRPASGVTITSLSTATASQLPWTAFSTGGSEASPTGGGSEPDAAQPTGADAPDKLNAVEPIPAENLTTGAKAGIACAVIGVIALLSGASYFFYLRGKAVGASRQDGNTGTVGFGLGGWGRRRRKRRINSTDESSMADLERGAEKFRSPSPTPKELSGEDKLPSELGSETAPTEIGTDWPVVAELSTGELCIEEMEREYGEIRLKTSLSPGGSGSLSLSPSPVSERGGNMKGEKPTPAVSPLTPSPPLPLQEPETDDRERHKGPMDGESSTGGVRHEKPKPAGRESKMMEIQIKLKDSDDDGGPRGDKG